MRNNLFILPFYREIAIKKSEKTQKIFKKYEI